jgi:membrane-associated phospholipid phosphatase
VIRAIVLVLLVLGVTPVRADPSERSDRDRVWHVAPFAVGAAVYLALEFGLKERISRPTCLWCTSGPVDAGFRTRLKWQRVENADLASNLTGYIGAPALAIGLLVATTADDPDLRRWFDDTVPVLQAGIITGMINQTFKLIFARRRPFAEFKTTSVQTRAGDVNTSFFSGHTALAFAMATASGTVASLRGYRTAPVFWAGGLALAGMTGYLRIGADAHYFTDVLAGAIVGSALGVAIPLLFHRDVLTDEPAPTARGQLMLSFGTRF